MRILYVGNFAPTSVGEPEAARALERAGHEVVRLEEQRTTVPDVYFKLKRGAFQILLFSKLRIGAPNEIAELYEHARRTGTKTVAWIFDLYFGLIREREILAKQGNCWGADIVFSTDGGHADRFAARGIPHHTLRQGIDVGEAYRSPNPVALSARIGFVGTEHTEDWWRYRPRLIRWLRERYGADFEVYGKNGHLRHEPLNDLLGALDVTIGDSVWSPHYWSNRVYETIGRGGLLIHHRVPGLDEEFTPGRHFVDYEIGDMGDLGAKIDYYLENPQKGDRIREAGIAYARAHHTYDHRIRKMLEILKAEGITE